MFETENYKIVNSDNLEYLKTLPDNFVDSVVTDPPYGLSKEPNIVDVMKSWCENGFYKHNSTGFMGKKWDSFIPQPILWKEVFRVLKPGGHVLCFCGTRTQDWMTASLRFAGFEIRDVIAYIYGCLSDDTEIYTKKGWIKYSELKKTLTLL
jgi:site-specific DNA-methyltransferase (adenine-specific)